MYLIDIVVPIRVRPKGRPRLTKYGQVYTPTAANEQDIAVLMRSLHNGPAVDELCRVEIDIGREWFQFRVEPLRGHKKVHRGDIDNLLKAIMDSAEKAGIITNDNLVRELEICEVDVELSGV